MKLFNNVVKVIASLVVAGSVALATCPVAGAVYTSDTSDDSFFNEEWDYIGVDTNVDDFDEMTPEVTPESTETKEPETQAPEVDETPVVSETQEKEEPIVNNIIINIGTPEVQKPADAPSTETPPESTETKEEDKEPETQAPEVDETPVGSETQEPEAEQTPVVNVNVNVNITESELTATSPTPETTPEQEVVLNGAVDSSTVEEKGDGVPSSIKSNYTYKLGGAWIKLITYKGTKTTVKVPATVKMADGTTRKVKVGSHLFKGNTSIRKVTFNAAVSGITCNSMFEGCTALVSANLPKDCRKAHYAFRNCRSLTSVSLPGTVQKMNFAFQNCKSLAKVKLPSNLGVANGIFKSCTALKKGGVTGISKKKAKKIKGFYAGVKGNIVK